MAFYCERISIRELTQLNYIAFTAAAGADIQNDKFHMENQLLQLLDECTGAQSGKCTIAPHIYFLCEQFPAAPPYNHSQFANYHILLARIIIIIKMESQKHDRYRAFSLPENNWKTVWRICLCYDCSWAKPQHFFCYIINDMFSESILANLNNKVPYNLSSLLGKSVWTLFECFVQPISSVVGGSVIFWGVFFWPFFGEH